MAGFGGSIKLTGEDAYKKALSQITQNLREVSSAMTLTTAQYNNSDKSLNALNQAQAKLSASYTKQLAEVEKLRSAYTSFAQKVETQAQAHQKLVDNYNKEKAELDKLEKSVGTTSQKYHDQKAKVESLAQEVAKSSKNNDDNAKALSKMGTALNKAETDLVKTEKEMKSLGKATNETSESVKDAGEGFSVFKMVLANLTTQAINGAINGMKKLGGAFISLGKQAISSYADYEQLVGGVETLFGDSAKIVQGYADEAYKTAGISANEYMSTVTSFSASLLSSLDGDTKKAAEYSNRALTDMSDNANKMGTDMSMIQNAYQGFAKQNYTMLDNLKLGYGGTKTEMERLIKEASQMTDVQEKLNLSVKDGDMSFGNIVNAISVVQSKMGIMGTTSLEASTTITGSVNSMKASWKNLLTGIADDNADFGKLVDNFVESLVTVANNLLPRIQTVISGIGKLIQGFVEKLLPKILESLPSFIQETLPILISSIETLIQGVSTALPSLIQVIAGLIPQLVQTLLSLIPQLLDVGIKVIVEFTKGITETIPQLLQMLPTLITDIVTTLMNNLPLIINAGVDLLLALVKGIFNTIPQLVEMLPTIIDTIVTTLIDNLPMIIDCAIEIMMALIDGLVESLPQLVEMIPDIIINIVNTLINHLPEIIVAGVKIITSLIQGIGNMISKVKEAIGKIGQTILNKLKELPSQMAQMGLNLIKGLWNGISDAGQWLWNKISGFFGGIMDKIKGFFGINSPSKLFRDEIGENLALGIGEGFSNEMNNVAKEMQGAIPTEFDTNATVTNGQYGSSTGTFTFDSMVLAFQEALANMKIELDDEEAGRFVRKTVEQAIYT